MPHKQGGKVTGSHTTVSDLSALVVDFLDKCASVSKISIGVITNEAQANGSIWTVKIVDETGCVMVRTTQKSTDQTIRFYTDGLEERQKAKLALARFVRNNGWVLRFGSRV